MASDGQVIFEVTADGKRAIADIKDITRAIQQETGKWDEAAKESTDSMGNRFSSMLKKLAAGFSAVKIGKALLDLGKDALEAASNLQEVQNVVDVTFGSNANQIETWAKNAGTQFGLTETQAKKFSSTMGAMLKSSGLAGQQIVDVSTDLAGLAADMASFYNLDFDEAFSKIRSGMSGMSMPLKELGIDMSVDTLNAFALANGLEKTFNQMSQSEQTMLRYQYLMSATADAQGDFARTSDEYANSVRTLESNVEKLKTALGQTFIDAVTKATRFLNSFIDLLLPDESKRTVLDDFADIDLKTEEKLEKIRQTAEEARLLTNELDNIGGSKADKAGSKVQQLADDLSNIKLNDGKAGAVKDFITVLASNIGLISDIQGSSAEGAKAWLDGIAESANKLDEGDAEGWIKLIEMIKEGLPGIENTDFGASFFSALGGEFSDVEQKSSVLQWAVEALGDKTNRTASEQALWLETCKRLVNTIPGLSSIINTETGEVKGGTQAIKDYVNAWEQGQTKLAMLQAHQQKGTALEEAFSDLPGLELNKKLAEWRIKKAYDEVSDIYKKYGQNLGLDSNGNIDISGFYGITEDELKRLEAFKKAVEDTGLGKELADTTEMYNTRKQAYDDAKEMYAEEEKMIAAMPGTIENANQATENWLDTVGKTDEEIQTLVTNAQDAFTNLADYVNGVRESVAKSIESTVKGFEKITTAADKNYADLTDDLAKLGDRTADNADEWDKLSAAIDKASGKESTTSSQQIAVNLQQQAEYMQKYLDMLNQAKEKGISNEVLAQLSDGSTESYDYLAALADASDDEVQEINKNYQSVIDKKKQLTDALTAQQLTVDQTYQSLASKAKEAVAALDLEESAKDNAGKTVAGMAQGIADHVGEVQAAVDSIIEQLNRLDGFGINIDFGGFGNIQFTTSTGQTEGSGRLGLDYIPHDDYIARLHEGEKVLTAQEASVYRGLANGSLAGVDLDQLGGVMRDNVQAGGNVYLDGKIVGSVVSDRQGKSYKSLQRSGWQA